MKRVSSFFLVFLIITLALAFSVFDVKANPDTTTLRPNANGTINLWTAVGDTPQYKCVDEEDHDEDTTYVQPPDGGGSQYFALPDPSHEGTISKVRVYARAKRPYAIYAEMRIDAFVNWVFEYGTYFAPSYNVYTDYYEEFPTLDGNAWTWDDIDDLQAVVHGAPEILGITIRVTQVWVEVYWEAAPAEYNFYGSISQLFSITSQRSWSFNRYSSINQIFSTQTEKTMSFSLFATISQAFSISSLFDYIQTRNFYGSITQILSATSKKTWIFDIQGLVQQVFGIESYTNLPIATLYMILGLISLALSCIAVPLSIRKTKKMLPFILSITAVAVTIAAIAIANLMVAALAFIMAIIALVFTLTKRREPE